CYVPTRLFCAVCLLFSFFSSCSGDLRDLHSFPTRRSSDLFVGGIASVAGLAADGHGLPVGIAFVRGLVVRRDGQIKALGHVDPRSEEHTSELQSRFDLVCRLLLEKKKK